MPLTTVRQEIANRFTEAQAFLTLIKADEQPFISQSQDLNTRKGLFIVLLYSAVEYSINRAVTKYTEIVNFTEVKYEHIDSQLYAFALDPQLTSCSMVGRELRWQKRFDLFHKQNSTESVKLFEGAFLDQLENIWDKTIRKTFNLLGIRDSALYDPRVAQYINEIVERRNAVAHGRESAAAVGQTYNAGRLQILHDEISTQIQYMIVCLEQHLDSKMFIKSQHKHAY
jgi:hypothetical protein